MFLVQKTEFRGTQLNSALFIQHLSYKYATQVLQGKTTLTKYADDWKSKRIKAKLNHKRVSKRQDKTIKKQF